MFLSRPYVKNGLNSNQNGTRKVKETHSDSQGFYFWIPWMLIENLVIPNPSFLPYT